MLLSTAICTVFSQPEERAFPTKTGETLYTYTIRTWAKIARDQTQWIEVSFRRGLCEGLIPHLKRGAVIFVCGDLRTSSYCSKLDGLSKVHTRIQAHMIRMVKFPPEVQPEATQTSTAESQTPSMSFQEPNLPKDPDMFDDSECPF